MGVVKSHSDNKDEVTVDVPVEQHDINEVYAAELKTLAGKAPKEVKVVSEDQKQEDYYKVGHSHHCAVTQADDSHTELPNECRSRPELYEVLVDAI